MSILSVTRDLTTSSPSVRMVYKDAWEGKHGINISPADADKLAYDLTKAAAEARANERRCGTCGHYDLASGLCFYRPLVAPDEVPYWVVGGRESPVSAGSQCKGWVKREGGQGNG